ncbi:MAG TPA: aldo/keto reductase [Polyangiales bacterium]|nr:aldo/keto reductase [Polyangiales bacterium]
MHHRKLGRTGLSVSQLCLGTMTFGLQSDEQTSRAVLDKAAAAGVNFLDTADVYPLAGGVEHAGRTEEIVGRWLKGKRHEYIVATKAVGKVGRAPWDQGASRKHILDAIESSLRRLQTDYVDLYQLHSDDRETPLDETVEALNDVVRSGKARYIGVSNFLAYRLARALGKQEARGFTRFVSVQPRYSLLFREIERELLPLTQEEGLGVIPYNPLAGGLLTGKHSFAAPPAPNTRFSGAAAERYQDRYWHEREFASVDAIKKVVKEADQNITTVAVQWVLANPAITSAIIGASKPEQLTDTLIATERPIDPQLKQRLDELTAEYRRGDAAR